MRQWRVAAIAAALVGAVLLPIAPAAVVDSASAADGAQFQAGFLVTDQNFFNGNDMTASQVQSFLDGQVGTCTSGSLPCLKSYSQSTKDVAATPMCQRYVGAPNESAATIIVKVAQSCGISARAILVTLQKEQGLVTSTHPSSRAYRSAMGAGCPDTAACDANYYGFFNQVHYGAYLFKRYTMPAGTGPGTAYYSVYKSYWPGAVAAIRYSPNASCGTQNVYVQNMATHVLYTYTPYVPNAVALQNRYLYGSTGDACSSYGNRNFWRIWSDWFGSPTNNNSPYGAITSTSSTQEALTVRGWGVDPDGAGNSDIALEVQIIVDGVKATTVSANLQDDSSSYLYQYYGVHHAFTANLSGVAPGPHRVCAVGVNPAGTSGSNTQLGCESIVVDWCGTSIVCPSATDRIEGDDRYQTSALIADQAYPNGATTAYVATGADFPDALSAAPAAVVAGGPLLLTAQAALPASTSAEIVKLGVKNVIILGGTTTVSSSVEHSLDALLGAAHVTRVAGIDRFETSRLVADSGVYGSYTGVYIAAGGNFPDALSGGPAAAQKREPILLVNGGARTLDAATLALLKARGVKNVTIIGSSASVSSGIQASIAAIHGMKVTRLGGLDRFQTSSLVLRSVHGSGPRPSAYLATGLNFPDGLSGSVVAAVKGAPLALVHSDCIPGEIVTDIEQLATSRLILLGGDTTLTKGVESLDMC